MSSSDDGGYVHDPSAFDGEGRRRPDETDDAIDAGHPATADREFDWRGWILVGAIVFAFVVAPGAILLIPPDTNYLFTLIVLPLVPAVLLALIAVWATTRS